MELKVMKLHNLITAFNQSYVNPTHHAKNVPL